MSTFSWTSSTATPESIGRLRPAILQLDVAAEHVAELSENLSEAVHSGIRRTTRLRPEQTDSGKPARLLCLGGGWSGNSGNTTDDECAPLHHATHLSLTIRTVLRECDR